MREGTPKLVTAADLRKEVQRDPYLPASAGWAERAAQAQRRFVQVLLGGTLIIVVATVGLVLMTERRIKDGYAAGQANGQANAVLMVEARFKALVDSVRRTGRAVHLDGQTIFYSVPVCPAAPAQVQP